MNCNKLLSKIKFRLKNVYEDRLCNIILYGSHAREETTPDSDIDIIVLLKGKIDYGKELRTCIHTLYSLAQEIGHPINPVVVNKDEYEAAEWPLFRNARKEGIVV